MPSTKEEKFTRKTFRDEMSANPLFKKIMDIARGTRTKGEFKLQAGIELSLLMTLDRVKQIATVAYNNVTYEELIYALEGKKFKNRNLEYAPDFSECADIMHELICDKNANQLSEATGVSYNTLLSLANNTYDKVLFPKVIRTLTSNNYDLQQRLFTAFGYPTELNSCLADRLGEVVEYKYENIASTDKAVEKKKYRPIAKEKDWTNFQKLLKPIKKGLTICEFMAKTQATKNIAEMIYSDKAKCIPFSKKGNLLTGLKKLCEKGYIQDVSYDDLKEALLPVVYKNQSPEYIAYKKFVKQVKGARTLKELSYKSKIRYKTLEDFVLGKKVSPKTANALSSVCSFTKDEIMVEASKIGALVHNKNKTKSRKLISCSLYFARIISLHCLFN